MEKEERFQRMVKKLVFSPTRLSLIEPLAPRWVSLSLFFFFVMQNFSGTFVKAFYYISTDYFKRLKSLLPADVIFLTSISRPVGCIKKSVENCYPRENVDFSEGKIEMQNIFSYQLRYGYFKMPLVVCCKRFSFAALFFYPRV